MVHSINNVVLGKHCTRSVVVARAFGVLSEASSSGGQVAMVAGAGGVHTLSAGAYTVQGLDADTHIVLGPRKAESAPGCQCVLLWLHRAP